VWLREFSGDRLLEELSELELDVLRVLYNNRRTGSLGYGAVSGAGCANGAVVDGSSDKLLFVEIRPIDAPPDEE
jgi:hypothetical protein